MTDRGLQEARLVTERELRNLAIDRDKQLEIAEIQKAI